MYVSKPNTYRSLSLQHFLNEQKIKRAGPSQPALLSNHPQ